MDDFEEEYEDEQYSGNSLADDIQDAKDTYDDVKEYYNKYKDYKSSQSTPNPQASQAPTSGTPTTGGTTVSGTATSGAATSGTAVGGTAAGGAATGGTAVGGTAAGGAAGGAAAGGAAGGATAGGAAAGGAAAGGAAAGGAAAGGTAAAGGAAAAGPPGWIAAAVILLLGGLKKEIEKRKKENAEQKVKRTIRELSPLLILAGIIMLPVILIVFTFSAGYTVTTYDSVERVDELVTCLESDSTCSEITDLELEEEVDGYGKPLVLFTKSELIEAAETYSKFSQKYFETGEGFFTDNYKDVKEDFGISEDYDLKKEELDSAVLANFFSLEARAFSKIDWIEVTWDETNECPIEKKIEDFDVFYDSSKDISNPRSWFAWLSPDKEEDYVIKIPSVEKYSTSNTETYIATHTIDDVVQEDQGTTSETQFPSIDQIKKPEYKQAKLKEYIDMVKEYLPQWYEPYSIYLATGDVKYAKKIYEKYLNLISSEDFKITIKLYRMKVKTDEDIKLDMRIPDPKNDNNSELKIVDRKVHTRKYITNIKYVPLVYSGAGFNGILNSLDISYYKEENVNPYFEESRTRSFS